MNKVSRKNKNCISKKPQQIGSQIKKTEPNDCSLNSKSLEDLKSKVKNVNGLVNGTTEDKNIKTEVEPSRNIEKQKPNNMGVDHKPEEIPLVQDLDAELSIINESDSKPDERHPKKTKAKKKCQEILDATGDFADDIGLLGSDILEHIRSRHKDFLKKNDVSTEIEEASSHLENLEIKEVPRVINPEIKYVGYESELQMGLIMKIIQKDLSEPYSIYTYRYFIHNWPNLCFLAMCDDACVGAIVCKLDMHRKVIKRGYIAMLAVDKSYRNYGIGSTLVRRAIQEMIAGEADEVVLETEITNKPALRLYEALGFVRDKRLFRYYLNGVDALRLKLWLR